MNKNKTGRLKIMFWGVKS